MKTQLSIAGEVVAFEPDFLREFENNLRNKAHLPPDITIPILLQRQSTRARIMSVWGSVLEWRFFAFIFFCLVAHAVCVITFKIHPDIAVPISVRFIQYSILVYTIVAATGFVFWRFFVAKYDAAVKYIESVLRQVHPRGEILPEYSQDAIRFYFEILANQYISAEREFDRVRLNTGRPVAQIKQTLEEYETAGESLDQAIEGFYTTFGMSWSRPELLRAAQARFDGATPTSK